MKKYYVIGLLAFFSIVVFFWGVNFFKGSNVFKSKTIYYSVYNNIDGLQVSNPIYFQGYQIGSVTGVSVLSFHSQEILVELNITEDMVIPVNSVAEIYSSDIMGSKAIKIILGNSNQNIQFGDTIKSNIEGDLMSEVNKQILPLKSKLDNMFGSLDNIFSENKNSLSGIIRNLESITMNINQNKESINDVFSNMSNISNSVNSFNIQSILTDFNTSLVNLNSILGKINEGENTFSLLLNNDKLYNNLISSSNSLDSLIIDIGDNPKKYINFSVIGGSSSKDGRRPGRPVK